MVSPLLTRAPMRGSFFTKLSDSLRLNSLILPDRSVSRAPTSPLSLVRTCDSRLSEKSAMFFWAPEPNCRA